MLTTIHEAKTNLSRLIARAERGEEVVIARGRQPVVRLEPVGKVPKKRCQACSVASSKLEPVFSTRCRKTN